MKLFSYCFHDLKMIIFYQGHAQLSFTRVTVLRQFFNSKSCLCNSSCSFQWILMKPSNYSLQLLLQFSVDFSETFQLLLPWPEEDHVIPRSHLTAFYQSYGPLSVLAILSTKFLSPQLLVHFSRDFDETFQLLLCPDVIWRNYRDGFVLQSIHRSVCPILSRQLLLQFSRDFDETFQLLFPWLKMIIFYRGHAVLIFTKVISLCYFFLYMKSWPCNTAVFNEFGETLRGWYYTKVHLTTFYKIYGPLLVLVMLQAEIIISATPHTVFKGFWWTYPDIVPMT